MNSGDSGKYIKIGQYRKSSIWGSIEHEIYATIELKQEN